MTRVAEHAAGGAARKQTTKPAGDEIVDRAAAFLRGHARRPGAAAAAEDLAKNIAEPAAARSATATRSAGSTRTAAAAAKNVTQDIAQSAAALSAARTARSTARSAGRHSAAASAAQDFAENVAEPAATGPARPLIHLFIIHCRAAAPAGAARSCVEVVAGAGTGGWRDRRSLVVGGCGHCSARRAAASDRRCRVAPAQACAPPARPLA